MSNFDIIIMLTDNIDSLEHEILFYNITIQK